MEKNKLAAILFGIAGFLWIITALVGENWIFIPIGLCYVVIGIIYARDKKEK